MTETKALNQAYSTWKQLPTDQHFKLMIKQSVKIVKGANEKLRSMIDNLGELPLLTSNDLNPQKSVEYENALIDLLNLSEVLRDMAKDLREEVESSTGTNEHVG